IRNEQGLPGQLQHVGLPIGASLPPDCGTGSSIRFSAVQSPYLITQKAPGETRVSPGPIFLLAGGGYSPPPPCCGVLAATGATIRSNSACGPGTPWIGTWVVTSSFSRLMLL